MSKTIEQLLALAQQIKNETNAKQNTATRVGGSLEDIIDKIEDVITSLATVAANEGTLASLTTTQKGNLVAAINELVTAISARYTKTESDAITGSLNSLATTVKSSLVGAINDLESNKATKAELATIGSKVGDLESKTDIINGQYATPTTNGNVENVSLYKKIYTWTSGTIKRFVVTIPSYLNAGVGTKNSSGWLQQVRFTRNDDFAVATIEVTDTDTDLYIYKNGTDNITTAYKVYDVTDNSTLESKIKSGTYAQVLISEGLSQDVDSLKSNSVSVNSQTFSDSQKEQARNNIGALSAAFASIINTLNNNHVGEAPDDGKEYVRKNKNWVENNPTIDAYTKTESDARYANNSALAELDSAINGESATPSTSGSVANVSGYKKIYTWTSGAVKRFLVAIPSYLNAGIGTIGSSGWLQTVRFIANDTFYIAIIDVTETDANLYIYKNGTDAITTEYKLYDVTGDTDLENAIKAGTYARATTSSGLKQEVGECVSVKSQTLTDTQKEQARTNINALSADALNPITYTFNDVVSAKGVANVKNYSFALPSALYFDSANGTKNVVQSGHKYKLYVEYTNNSTGTQNVILRTIKSWNYKQYIVNNIRITTGETHCGVYDLDCTADGDVVFQANSGTAGDAVVRLYVYDVTDVDANVLKRIDFTTKSQVTYTAPSLDGKIDNLQKGLWLKGKLACGIGDSFTDNWTAGGFYRTYVKNALGLADYTDCGVSGSLISGTSGMSSDARVNEVDLGADIISIFGGMNDVDQGYYEEHPSSAFEGWGEMTKSNCNVKTFVGAYNVLLSKLYYKFKMSEGYYYSVDYTEVTRAETARDIVLFCVTPTARFDGTEAKDDKVGVVAEKVRQIAEMWNLPIVDLRKNVGYNYMNKSFFWTHQTTPDWLHPSPDAHKRIASLIIAKLKELTMYFDEM